MDRKRISDEVIEILCHKLLALPLPGDDPDYDYTVQNLVPEITDNELDIAEVAMDLEDAFDVQFLDTLPGSEALPTIGDVINFIEEKVNAKA